MYDYKNKILNQKPSFSHSALFDATSDVINDFYFSDGIIKKLKLPLTPIQLLKNEPLNENSLTTMKIWMGPFPIIWEAQHVEVSKENGFTDTFFEKIFFYLIGYEDEINSEISEDSLLDFHLSHRTNLEFKFIPKNSTSNLVWK